MKDTASRKNYQVEKIMIRPHHPLYPYCSDLCRWSSSLYNASLFRIRQSYTAYGKNVLSSLQEESRKEWETYMPLMQAKHPSWESPFDTNKIPSFYMLDALLKLSGNPDYYQEGFPIHTAQHCIKQACQDMKSYLASMKEYKKNPAKFLGKPKLPKYKKNGMTTAVLSNQECRNQDGRLKLPKTALRLDCRPACGKLKEVRIVPFHDVFFIMPTYEGGERKSCRTSKNIASIDLGVDNLAAVANNTGAESLLFSGRALKSIKEKEADDLALLASRQTKGTENKLIFSRKARQIVRKNSLRTTDYLHKSACAIIRWCRENDIDTLVVGSNRNWKQNANIGHDNNRRFGKIPFDTFKRMLEYRCRREGINYVETEEAYTSKASFYDKDGFDASSLTGRRIKRGLYRRSGGELVNADLNGAANIGRKVFPELFEPEKVDLRHIRKIKHPEFA